MSPSHVEMSRHLLRTCGLPWLLLVGCGIEAEEGGASDACQPGAEYVCDCAADEVTATCTPAGSWPDRSVAACDCARRLPDPGEGEGEGTVVGEGEGTVPDEGEGEGQGAVWCTPGFRIECDCPPLGKQWLDCPADGSGPPPAVADCTCVERAPETCTVGDVMLCICSEWNYRRYPCEAPGRWPAEVERDLVHPACQCEVDEECHLVPGGPWNGVCNPPTDLGRGGPELPDLTERPVVALDPLGDCADLEAQLRHRAIVTGLEAYRQLLDRSLEQLRDDVCQRCSYRWQEWEGECQSGWFEGEGEGESAEGEGEDDGADEYSETNTQEEGVDEADFVKNDGRYVYLLTPSGLHILDAWPAADTHPISSTPLPGTPRKLYVEDGLAFVYSSGDELVEVTTPWDRGYGQGGECTYGYDCQVTGDGHDTVVTILDLYNPNAPRRLRQLSFSGSYINSRRIGRAVHSVLQFPQIFPFRWPQAYLDVCELGPDFSEATVRAEVVRRFEQWRQEVERTELSDRLPWVIDVQYDERGGVHEERRPLLDCQGLYSTNVADGNSLLAVISQDLGGEGRPAVSTVLDKPGIVYASGRSLYLATRHEQGGGEWYDEGVGTEATTIHKFELHADPPGASYVGSGLVEGRVLNQFSLSEWDGRLRLATTSGHLPGPTTNTVFVLEPAPGGLVTVGRLDGIGRNEDIRSARFVRDRGYVVTFKKTDPLFVLDLADPHHPAVTGELHIPGFSTYLHPLDDEHLLSIGYDSDDHGDFAYFDGLLLQLFDVGDMAQPTLVDREVIGTRGSGSDAATNHLAFTYFRPREALAIPMIICEGGNDGRFGDRMTFNGLLVYHANQEGLEPWGRVPHALPAAGQQVCGQWWSNASSPVKRSIFLEDYVFSISSELLKVNSLADNLAETLVTIDLTRL